MTRQKRLDSLGRVFGRSFARGNLGRHVSTATVSGVGRIHDLDYEESRMRQKWEYRVIETPDRSALQTELAAAGADGWELVSVTAMFNTMMTKVNYTLFFKRLGS